MSTAFTAGRFAYIPRAKIGALQRIIDFSIFARRKPFSIEHACSILLHRGTALDRNALLLSWRRADDEHTPAHGRIKCAVYT